MPPLMLPETFAPLAAAFAPCFSAPTYRVFLVLVAGWAQPLGARGGEPAAPQPGDPPDRASDGL
jgi:hypothetical protein